MKADHRSFELSAAKQKVARLGDLFLEQGLLDAQQIEQIGQTQRERKMRFGDAALYLGFLTQSQIDAALGEQFGHSYQLQYSGIAGEKLTFLRQPFSRESEEIRRLRSELLLKFANQDQIRIAVVSAGTGDGKSYMAASLAVALAQAGRRTLLIDADLRQGDLHHLFGFENPDGLSSVLAQRRTLDEVALPLMPNLHFLPAGPLPPNPLELIRLPEIRRLLENHTDRFDAFILDTFPASLASDAQMIAHQTGHALLIARKDQTEIDDLRTLRESMQIAGVEVLGTVFNHAPHADQKSTLLSRLRSFFRFGRRKG